MSEFTSTGAAYIESGERVPTMSNSEIAETLEAAGIAPSSFSRLLGLNVALGGRRIPVRQRVGGIQLRTVFHQIGAQRGTEPTLDPEPSFEFFDFGVAAPLSVEVASSGAVIANFGGSGVDVAESFEVFIEGVARRVLAETSGGTRRAIPIDCGMNEVLLDLPEDGIVTEASDQWTTWWQTDNFLAELFTMWDLSVPRSMQLNVWANGPIPSAFERLLRPR